MELKTTLLLAVLVVLAFLAACSTQTVQNSTSDAVSLDDLPERVGGGGDHREIIPPSSGNEVGVVAPDFTATTTEGEEFTLSSFKGEKPVMVYFMATWCPFCRQDFKTLGSLYGNYEDSIEMITMSLDLSESANTLSNYKTQFSGIDAVQFTTGQSSVLQAYSVSHTTTKYAIAKDGTILYKGSGAFSAEQWDVLLQELVETI